MLSELDEKLRADRLCELNVIEQVINVCQTTIVQSAWERGQELAMHGWIYGLGDGLIRDLNVSISNQKELPEVSAKAVAAGSKFDAATG